MNSTVTRIIDIYQFPDSHTLEEYARLEAGIYGAPYYIRELDSGKTAGYISAELYDEEWYIQRTSMTEHEGMIQEICSYFRTRPVTLDDSSRQVFLPVCFTEAADEYTENGTAYINSNELADRVNDPYRIETFSYENILPRKLVQKLTDEYGLETEEVTVCGHNYYVLYGSIAEAEVKLYLFKGDNGVSGINFLYHEEPNGYDLAVMNTAR